MKGEINSFFPGCEPLFLPSKEENVNMRVCKNWLTSVASLKWPAEELQFFSTHSSLFLLVLLFANRKMEQFCSTKD